MKKFKKLTPKTWYWRKFALTFSAEIVVLLAIILGLYWWTGSFDACENGKAIPGTVVAQFKPDVTSEQAKDALWKAGLKPETEGLDSLNSMTVVVPKGKEAHFIDLLNNDPLVDKSGPEIMYCLD